VKNDKNSPKKTAQIFEQLAKTMMTVPLKSKVKKKKSKPIKK
jgi:hypothetical protein